MSLRDKKLIGELQRQIVRLNEENLKLRQLIDADPGAALFARRVRRKPPPPEFTSAARGVDVDWGAAPPSFRPEFTTAAQRAEELNFLKTTTGVSEAARTHLLELFSAAGQDSYPRALEAALVRLVKMYYVGWTTAPTAGDDLIEVLGVTTYGFFRWLRTRSPLISIYGRDVLRRITYTLHLEHLGATEIPVVAPLPPWFDDFDRRGD